jgi:SnoaL-like domain
MLSNNAFGRAITGASDRVILLHSRPKKERAMSSATTPSQDGSMVASEGSAHGPAVPLAPAARRTLAKWLAMVTKGDFLDLPSIIASDAVYTSPVEWHPYPGRDLVCLLVRTAGSVLEDFRYHRQFAAGDSAALEFSAHIGNEPLRAVHLLRFNDAGEIRDIDLIARPAKGVMALGNGVGSRAGPQIKAALAANSARPNSDAQAGQRE